MPRYEMSAAAGAGLLLRLGDVQERAAIREQNKTLPEAKRALVRQSSGTTSTAELRRMGHPFAVRSPQTPVDSRVINNQGGPFRRSWTVIAPVTLSDGRVVSYVRNTDPKAVYMLGTSRMIRRDIVGAVEPQIAAGRRRRFAYYYHQEFSAEAQRVGAKAV